MDYLWLKYIHILSSTLLFGTGLGSAFYLLRAHLSRDIAAIAFATRNVVFADWAFTTPAVIIQPLTGIAMMQLGKFDFSQTWLWVSLVLYILTGLCWLPVVCLQIRLRDLAQHALQTGSDLPLLYHHYMRIWFWLGWPAFISVIIIFQLMVFKPCY
jgi:uncharacterized membrane protein